MDRYETSLEHLLAELERIDLLVQLQVNRARQANQIDGEFRGLYISENEVDALLAEPTGLPRGDDFFEVKRSVTEVSGIGAKREILLTNAGIIDLERLASADPEFVAKVLGVLLAVATGYVTEAQNLLRFGAR